MTFDELAWASRAMSREQFESVRRFGPGEALPPGEYFDARTGAIVPIWKPGAVVPSDTVYLEAESVRDLGILAY
ncbi:MAG TPA: hypothetical protein VIN09_06110 [Chloroflexota bacterium]